MSTKLFKAVGFLFVSFAIHSVNALPLYSVPGIANPWLAGMPAGTQTQSGDQAMAQSPVNIGTISEGTYYSFSATGLVSFSPNDPNPLYSTPYGPDGNTSLITYHAQQPPLPADPFAEFGISSVTAPYNALIGVFLGPNEPDPSSPPPALEFATQSARDYLTLAPLLQQPFFIGDGLTSLSEIQKILAPMGATRLFLGVMDSGYYGNNSGSFRVNVDGQIPEPNTGFIFLLGLAALWFIAVSGRAQRQSL